MAKRRNAKQKAAAKKVGGISKKASKLYQASKKKGSKKHFDTFLKEVGKKNRKKK